MRARATHSPTILRARWISEKRMSAIAQEIHELSKSNPTTADILLTRSLFQEWRAVAGERRYLVRRFSPWQGFAAFQLLNDFDRLPEQCGEGVNSGIKR